MGHEKDLINDRYATKERKEMPIPVKDKEGKIIYYTSEEHLKKYVSESKP